MYLPFRMFHGPNEYIYKVKQIPLPQGLKACILAFINISENSIITELFLLTICPFKISSVSFNVSLASHLRVFLSGLFQLFNKQINIKSMASGWSVI